LHPGGSFFAASSARHSVAAAPSTGLPEQSWAGPVGRVAGPADPVHHVEAVLEVQGVPVAVRVVMFEATAVAGGWGWPALAGVPVAVEVDSSEAGEFGSVAGCHFAAGDHAGTEEWHLEPRACWEAALSRAAEYAGHLVRYSPEPVAELGVVLAPAGLRRAAAVAAGGSEVGEGPAAEDASSG